MEVSSYAIGGRYLEEELEEGLEKNWSMGRNC